MFRLRRRVYCDNNATTMVSPAVRKRVGRVLARAYGNPSSPYNLLYRQRDPRFWRE